MCHHKDCLRLLDDDPDRELIDLAAVAVRLVASD